MGFEQPFQSEPEEERSPVPKPSKSGLERFLRKTRTTAALGAALVGITATTPDFEANAAERPVAVERGPVNDATRNDRFYAFTERYTAAVKLVKKAKTQEDAAKALTALNSAVSFVEASKRHTAGQNPSLDKRYIISLKDMKKAADGLQQFGVAFDSAGLDSLVASFKLHQEIASRPVKKPNDGWIKTQTMGPTSIGINIDIGGGRPASVPRPVPVKPPRKR